MVVGTAHSIIIIIQIHHCTVMAIIRQLLFRDAYAAPNICIAIARDNDDGGSIIIYFVGIFMFLPREE